MKNNTTLSAFTILLLLVLSVFSLSYAQNSSCSKLNESEVAGLLRQAAELEQSGDEAGAKALMEQAARLTEADLLQAIEQPFPDPQGLYCKDNPTVRHIACLLKLTARVELTGNSDLSARGMQRAAEGVDFWTSQFAHTPVPEGNDLCREYLACIFKAMAQRELIGIEHSAVDDLLQAKADEILKKGCNPCETKWVAVGKVDINWVSDDEHVSISGYAQWVNFHLIANLPELEDKCMHLNYDDRLTFPYACDGGVISHKGGKITTTLTMTDGDNTFATDMIEGDLIICASNTLNPKDLYLRAYLGFSDHGQSVEVSLVNHLSAIKSRKPFKVTETVTNEEVPSYNAKFVFLFYPVSGWELGDF